jgi:hypothetical protein
MKTATSLLLGAALATAFFLLYTSLCRDLNGGPQPPPPQQQRWEKKATEAGAAGGDREVRHPNPKQQEGVAEKEVVVVTRGDGDRGDGTTAGEKANRGAEEKRQQVTRLPLSPSFLCHT